LRTHRRAQLDELSDYLDQPRPVIMPESGMQLIDESERGDPAAVRRSAFRNG